MVYRPPTDPDCPTGFRFLVQLVEDQSEQEARQELLAMFGGEKMVGAVLVPGVRIWQDGTSVPQKMRWGWRCYVPIVGHASGVG